LAGSIVGERGASPEVKETIAFGGDQTAETVVESYCKGALALSEGKGLFGEQLLP